MILLADNRMKTIKGQFLEAVYFHISLVEHYFTQQKVVNIILVVVGSLSKHAFV